MALADALIDIQEVADDGYLAVKAATGEEAEIRFITLAAGTTAVISHYDGTDEVPIKTIVTNNGTVVSFGLAFPVTDTKYLRVQNLSGAAKKIGYSGVITKVAG